VKQALERLAGVKNATADRTKNEARATYEDTAVKPDAMVGVIQKAGRFQARQTA
jgi:copper chaperone CopZ